MRLALHETVRSGVAVELARPRVPPPELCACCGGAPSHRRALSSRGQTLLVPYCEDCARHAAVAEARALSLALSSGLLGLTAACALPLLWPHVSLLASLGWVALAALLPLGFALWARPEPAPPHTARARAVWWLALGRLACTHAGFAQALAELQGTRAEARALSEPRARFWSCAGLPLALGVAYAAYVVLHPWLYVVNLTDRRLEVRVDGVSVGWVEPSSLESPQAGRALRVPAGAHQLVARGPDAKPVAALEARFPSGTSQLFAPGSAGFCFWLETEGYARERRVAPVYVPLVGERRFWVLPDRIDSWFTPNPPDAPEPFWASGRILTALRQARCDRAPDVVRQAQAPGGEPAGGPESGE